MGLGQSHRGPGLRRLIQPDDLTTGPGVAVGRGSPLGLGAGPGRNLGGVAQIEANGITIEYDDRGDGDPLLFVMGLGGQLTSWPDDLVDTWVDRGFRVIRFDNRDSGLSTAFDWTPAPVTRQAAAVVARRRPAAGYHLDDMADDAAGLLDALGIDAAHVMGVSMGGMISQLLAIRYPEKVRSLTSIMSQTGDARHGLPTVKTMVRMARRPTPTMETAVEQEVETTRFISGSVFDEERARQLAKINNARSFRPTGTGRQLTAILAARDRTAALRRLTVPTLVVHGLQDPLVQPSGAMATCRAVSGSRLVMYPDMGHNLPAHRWPELADEVRTNADRAS